MQPSLSHILARTTKLRRQFEQERRRSASPSRLLRLQALLLRAQKHLAEMIDPASPRMVRVSAIGPQARAGSSATRYA